MFTLSCPSPSGSCSSFLSSSAQSTCWLFPESSLSRRRGFLRPRGDSSASVSRTDTLGLSAVRDSMLSWLFRRPKALSISLELGLDESLRSSIMILGRCIDSRGLSSSGIVPASDNGTVTIESVGWWCGILGECVTSSTLSLAPSLFVIISIEFVLSIMTSIGCTWVGGMSHRTSKPIGRESCAGISSAPWSLGAKRRLRRKRNLLTRMVLTLRAPSHALRGNREKSFGTPNNEDSVT